MQEFLKKIVNIALYPFYLVVAVFGTTFFGIMILSTAFGPRRAPNGINNPR